MLHIDQIVRKGSFHRVAKNNDDLWVAKVSPNVRYGLAMVIQVADACLTQGSLLVGCLEKRHVVIRVTDNLFASITYLR